MKKAEKIALVCFNQYFISCKALWLLLEINDAVRPL